MKTSDRPCKHQIKPSDCYFGEKTIMWMISHGFVRQSKQARSIITAINGMDGIYCTKDTQKHTLKILNLLNASVQFVYEIDRNKKSLKLQVI